MAKRACLGVAAVLVLLLQSLLPVIYATSSWSPCDKNAKYAVTVKDVTIQPDPVVSGGEASFIIPTIAHQEISGGTVVVTVTYYGFKVHTERDDLCSKSRCPIAPGEFQLNNTEVLPVYTPPGSYKIKLQIFDQDNILLGCANINFNIVWDLRLHKEVKKDERLQSGS